MPYRSMQSKSIAYQIMYLNDYNRINLFMWIHNYERCLTSTAQKKKWKKESSAQEFAFEKFSSTRSIQSVSKMLQANERKISRLFQRQKDTHPIHVSAIKTNHTKEKRKKIIIINRESASAAEKKKRSGCAWKNWKKRNWRESESIEWRRYVESAKIKTWKNSLHQNEIISNNDGSESDFYHFRLAKAIPASFAFSFDFQYTVSCSRLIIEKQIIRTNQKCVGVCV